MTYKLIPEKSITSVSIEDYKWFQKTYESIKNWETRDVDDVDREYEKKFKVTLHYGQADKPNSLRPITAIEFPSEAEAILFMLKWG